MSSLLTARISAATKGNLLIAKLLEGFVLVLGLRGVDNADVSDKLLVVFVVHAS